MQCSNALCDSDGEITLPHFTEDSDSRSTDTDMTGDSDIQSKAIHVNEDGVNDHHLGGPRGYRTLRPLLSLHPPQHLTILGDLRDGGIVGPYPGNLHFTCALEYQAAVIARLKDSVMDSSKSATFAAIDHHPVGGKEEDSTWLWEALNADEQAQMERFMADRRKFDKVTTRLGAIVSILEPERYWWSNPVHIGRKTKAKLARERENLERSFEELALRLKPLAMNSTLVKRCRVHELASDPEWETKVESEATESWYHSNSSEDDDDSLPEEDVKVFRFHDEMEKQIVSAERKLYRKEIDKGFHIWKLVQCWENGELRVIDEVIGECGPLLLSR